MAIRRDIPSSFELGKEWVGPRNWVQFDEGLIYLQGKPDTKSFCSTRKDEKKLFGVKPNINSNKFLFNKFIVSNTNNSFLELTREFYICVSNSRLHNRQIIYAYHR